MARSGEALGDGGGDVSVACDDEFFEE
ncbi:unnamed protein product [Cuscuta europaea]|uniref:Uncharacterized protein n=1 Tax=Cuscuta europaea TaxID=41803 RepID=A0A9P1E8R1_CUSEU|nr:unnamed protein product [Cuscuta europaea]